MWLYDLPTISDNLTKGIDVRIDETDTYYLKEDGSLFTGAISSVIRNKFFKKSAGVMRTKCLSPAGIPEVHIIRWVKNGKLHRDEDLPAQYLHTYKDQTFKYTWYKESKIHRLNGPAVMIYSSRAPYMFSSNNKNGLKKSVELVGTGYYVDGECLSKSIREWSKNNAIPLYKLTDPNMFNKALKEI